MPKDRNATSASARNSTARASNAPGASSSTESTPSSQSSTAAPTPYSYPVPTYPRTNRVGGGPLTFDKDGNPLPNE